MIDINLIHTLTQIHIDSMKDGDKTTMASIVTSVANQMNVSEYAVRGFVSAFVNDHPGMYVSRGKFGGVFKGMRKVARKDPRPRCPCCSQVVRPDAKLDLTVSQTVS